MTPTPMPPMTRRRPVGRAGFTLVELLVACALTVLVMAILATAFQKGMETLSTLKSAVGLSEQLRSAEGIIRRDLANVRLESRSGGPVRVSDRQLATAAWASPDRGFFRIKHGSAPVYENVEDGVQSYRAADHELAMTVKLPGGSASEVFIADANGLPPVPPAMLPTPNDLMNQSQQDYVPLGSGQFAGQWAEVAYFLVPSAMMTTAADGSPGLQLYTLRRRFRALAPSARGQVPLTGPYTTPELVARGFPELSVSPVPSPPPPATPQFATVNTPADVADRTNRLWDYNPAVDVRASKFTPLVRAIPQSNLLGGSDVLLTNVVSFQVLPLTSADVTRYRPDLPDATNAALPVNYATTPVLAYPPAGAALDTADAPTSANPKPLVRSVQIRLRVYDVRNKLTRQMTITQDL